MLTFPIYGCFSSIFNKFRHNILIFYKRKKKNQMEQREKELFVKVLIWRRDANKFLIS